MASENGKFRAPATQGQDYGSNPLIALRAQMDRLFDDFFGGRLMRSPSARSSASRCPLLA